MRSSQDTRHSSRARVQARIIFKIPSRPGDRFLTFNSENISEGGVFLKYSTPTLPFHSGDVVDLHFSLPSSPVLIHAKGKIIWTTEGWSKDMEGVNGFGVQFTFIKDEFRQLIRRFVTETVASDKSY